MIKINNIEILTVLDGISWGGASDQVARTLDFKFIYSHTDKNFPVYKVQAGDNVEWIEGGKTRFLGYVQSTDYTTDDNVVNVQCIDYSIKLQTSKFVGRLKGTLTEICNNICGLFGFINGISSESTHINNIVSDGDMTYAEVIGLACKSVFDRYCIYLDGKTLRIADQSVTKELIIKQNIRTSNFATSIENMVNKVIMIDNNGNIIGSVQNDDNLKKYGLFQEVYNYDKDCKNNKAEAEKMLKGLENKASLTCDNDNDIVSGNVVKIIEPINNFQGNFYVKTDNHTIGNDSSMVLEVENV